MSDDRPAVAAEPSHHAAEAVPAARGQANSLLSYVNSTAGIVGPAAGALLFKTVGPHLTVGVLALLYLGAAPVLIGIPAPRSAGATATSWRGPRAPRPGPSRLPTLNG